MDLITKTDADIHSNLKRAFVAITAIQLGLVDLLTTIDVKPVGLIGYSIGELACAYCDGALSLEQAILCAYYLGQAAEKCKSASGTMISVESGYENVRYYSFIHNQFMVTRTKANSNHKFYRTCRYISRFELRIPNLMNRVTDIYLSGIYSFQITL